jgi:hypothetical protein
MSFGHYDTTLKYKSVDENLMKHSATVMLYWGLATFTFGYMMQLFWILPWMLGLFVLNFMIGLFIKLEYAPSMLIAKLLHKEEPQPIGAVQKQFAWYLGLLVSIISLVLSIFLQSDPDLFVLLCGLCIFCNSMLYFEAILGFCVGCQLYKAAKTLGLVKTPKVQPKCMGNQCDSEV